MHLRSIRKWFRVSRRDSAMVGIGMLAMLLIVGFVVFARNSLETPLAPTSKGTLTITWLPDTVTRWREPLEAMGKRYKIDPNLLAIIMTMESGGYSRANSGQAQGLMQITPATGKDIANRYITKPTTTYDLYNPQTSIEFGAAYLATLRNLYGKDVPGPSWTAVELIAAAYNGGFGAANAIEKGEGINDSQTVVYSRDVFNMWRERTAARSPTFERWKERGGADLIAKAHQEMKAKR